MPVELNAFKALLGDWLLGITGMSALVGTRVHNGWPQQPPQFPMIVFSTGPRVPNTDFPQHAWAGTVDVDLWGTDSDVIDTIEDLIVNELAGEPVASGSLTDARVLCHECRLTQVGPDTEATSMEDGSYVAMSRTVTLAFSIVGKEI